MKTLKVLLQEVVSGIKAWVNSNFAQESNTVHKTGNETVNGVKTFTGNLFHQNSRSIYRNTNISRETPPEANTAVDTYSHLGVDWAYWGGLKHIWKTDGTSITELAIANHRQVNGTWSQGFWSLQLSALKDFSNIEFIPSGDATINLGSSSKQWKSVYAKTYYYNGTAWGLDKANHWSANQYIENSSTPKFVLKDNRNDRTYTETDVAGGVMRWECVDKDDAPLSRISTTFRADKAVQLQFSILNEDSSGTEFERTLRFVTSSDPSVLAVFYPEQTELTELGNSTHKWKTFNGANPGALSLPRVATTFEDLTGYVLDGVTENSFPISGTTLNGWLQCRVTHTIGTVSFLRMEMAYRVWTAQDKDCVTEYTLWVPVQSGQSLKVFCLADDLKIRFHPCVGNV